MFEDWVRFYFDRPEGEPAWYWRRELWSEWPKPEPKQFASWTRRVFCETGSVLAPYSDAQCGRGIHCWTNNSVSNDAFLLFEPEVSDADRDRWLDGVVTLYRDFLAARLSPFLAHANESPYGPLDHAAYMWWDVFPFHAGSEGDDIEPWRLAFEAGIVECCGRILEIDHDRCREAALHGIGHYHNERTDARIQEIVLPWLDRHPEIRPDLRDYAYAARNGHVQ